MFKKSIIALSLYLIVLVSSQSIFEPNRFELIVKTLTRPITYNIQAFKEELARNIKLYTNLSLPEEDSELLTDISVPLQKRNPKMKSVLNDLKKIKAEKEDTVSETSNQRLLQSTTCANGFQVRGNRTRYYYQGTELSYGQALNLINGNAIDFNGNTLSNISQTNAVNSQVNLCWCPLDYFGDRCEFLIPLMCQINQTIPTCPKIDPFVYSFNFTGDPPCLRVKKGNPFNFK